MAVVAGFAAPLLKTRLPGDARLTWTDGGITTACDATVVLFPVLNSKKLSFKPVMTTTYFVPTSVAGTVIVAIWAIDPFTPRLAFVTITWDATSWRFWVPAGSLARKTSSIQLPEAAAEPWLRSFQVTGTV